MNCKGDCLHLITVHRVKNGKIRCAYCRKLGMWLKVRCDGTVKRGKRCEN